VFKQNLCKGCKLGYGPGERDLNKAKCAMKVCCLRRALSSCADCAEYETCPTLAAFYAHAGYKYRKYREAAAFIRAQGMKNFFVSRMSGTGRTGNLSDHVRTAEGLSFLLLLTCGVFARRNAVFVLNAL
jgi:hypothetical protein